MPNMQEPKILLKKYFGYDEFRPAQDAIIADILKKRDTLAVMPTGAGKSICFQIPALIFDGLTIVISPLISLMKDQVDSLNTEGIPATYLNGTLDRSQIDERLSELKKGKYKLLYIAPERMMAYNISSIKDSREISMIAVDEAHCISHWGHDFRPHYGEIHRFASNFSPRPVIAAFTATATSKVQEDICDLLKLQNPAVHISGFDRPNLFFSVLRNIDKDKFVLSYVKEHIKDSGIIYASTQKEVERLNLFLMQNGIKVAKYHAGMPSALRTKAQDDFIYDRASVIVATLAFGMGIDKSNIRYVIHYNMPKSVEGYYQEAGRAGRDGERSECILLFSPRDVETQKYLITHSAEEFELSPERVAANMSLLQKMVNYCHTPHCLRRYLLNYFNDKTYAANCQNCGNCLADTEEKDITLETQKILSCVYRMKERAGTTFGASITADVLGGSKNSRVKSFGFQSLSTYGIMKDKKANDIRELINILVSIGYLGVTKNEYPTLILTDKAVKMLKNKEQVFCRIKTKRDDEHIKAKDTQAEMTDAQNDLFEKLKALRLKLAQEEHKPAFMIFSDATLRLMAKQRPADLNELRRIQGVGEKKLEAFGEAFLRVIGE